MMSNERNHAGIVVQLADELASKGWLPATSGNLSVRVSASPLLFAITRSGADKQHLRDEDVLVVNADNQVVKASEYRPSAETIVHTKLYQSIDCGCVLHVHTMYNNLMSEFYFERGFVPLTNHELLKALDHWEPNASIDVPIVENFHDLQQLGDAVEHAAREGVPGVLVRNHGIYAWGKDEKVAKRYLEAFEFLFQYDFQLKQLAVYHRMSSEGLLPVFAR